jgi:hypothetical protein
MRRAAWLVVVVACSSSPNQEPDGAPAKDASASDSTPPPPPSTLGTVTNVRRNVTCPQGATGPCIQVTVSGCPGIESEALDAFILILPGGTPSAGTILHFSGDDGTTFNRVGMPEYQQAGFLQAFVAWQSPGWEKTAASGIRTGGCRPATLIRWMFDEPAIHNGDRTLGYCAEGHSGGSGQLGYALAFYGMGDYLDYVNEVSGPPFGRIDIGCNADAPQTQSVCGVDVPTQLPPKVGVWENSMYCNQHNVPATELARWKADSVSVGGTYLYPNTTVRFFDCTNRASPVTAMSTYYHDAMMAAGSDVSRVSYTCYSAADGCMGEDLGTKGGADAVAAMTAGCIANHR